MNFNTNINNFNLNDFKLDINKIEISESEVWKFHKENNIIELFNKIKGRKLAIGDLLEIYIKSNYKSAQILNEIKNKYPEIKSINFYNNYENIIQILTNLNLVSINQFDKINLSENLINNSSRENILNGNKIKTNESEFTTLVSKLLSLINLEEKEEENNLIQEEKEIEIIKTNVESNIEIENLDKIEVQIKTENNRLIIEEENLNNKLIGNSKNLIEDITEKITDNKNTIDVEIEVPIKEERSYFTIKHKEVSSEEIEKNIEKYFAYQDSTELSEEEKENILKQSLKSNSAIKYAKVLLKLKDENLLEEAEYLSKQLFVKTLTALSQYNIEPTSYSMSQSWSIWDIAKQFYYLEHPDESNDNYNLENPIESESMQQEIIDRHIGWVVYTQMTTGKLDKFLNKIQGSIYGKRIVDFMISKPNNNETLPSYKLANLGKNVRLGFEE